MGAAVFRLPQLARLALFTFVFADFSHADVQFTAPSAGQNVPAGTIDVEWKDSGDAPSIQDLTGFTLSLMVGGNDDGHMLALTTFESQGTFTNGNHASGTIPSGIAGVVDNGFFFRIVSTASSGGTVINYSPRFNLTGLTGTTPPTYRQAAEDLNGSTEGPSSRNPYSNSSSSASASSAATPTTISQSTAASPADLINVTPSSNHAMVTSTSLPTPQSHPPSTSHGLSSMAKALIAVGSVGGGIALCASSVALVFLSHRRKQQRQARKMLYRPFMDAKIGLATIPDSSKWQSAVAVSELSHEGALVEADDGQPRPELDHMAFRAELEGSRPGTARGAVN
ncbi:beta-1,6-glucan boisynthesis protein-like protein [Teratosphaeria destructans]|uniref:Beta-1,6-glucan boisynthesis protein-like protein n=1 Tax=Teratosphaeria destructans TaxID=418781 RepID=A0A9W7SW08_9PEZI|nr:beta-1,6-glucan boisynthesis protein-like protein [Teratosphaeria destructans]